MRVFQTIIVTLLFTAASSSFGQTPEAPSSAPQSRVVGVVSAVNKDANQITVKSDTGESIVINTNANSALLRLPAGETSAQNAAKIALAEIGVGDKLFARGAVSGDGKSIDARQVVVTGVAVSAGTSPDQRQRDDFRQRGLVGRVTALNSDKKEISVQSRSREGTGPITVSVSDATRIFRYAPDSMNIKDASRSSFSQLRIGDQVRALGERNADGTHFTAEEIIAGTMARTGGQVVSVDPAKNELTLKNQAGKMITVAVGPRSSLRRVTPEAAASFEVRPARPAPGAAREGEAGRREGRQRERRERGSGAGGEGRRPGGGRGFQGMLESLPAITLNDLKKGDTVFVSGSEGADPSRVTAIMLVTGDPAFMIRFLQPGPNRGPQNPGLPGDVIGGGVGQAERPTSP
jgi:hypothetical protein